MPLQVHILNLEDMGSIEFITAKQMRHTVSRHIHDSLCIGIIQAGARKCILPNSQCTALSGQVVVINPGEVHACCAEDDKPYDYIMLCIKNVDQILRILGGETTAVSLPCFASVLADENLFQKITSFTNLSLSSASLLELQTAFLDLFAHLVISCDKAKANPVPQATDQPAVSKIYHYLQVHSADEISLQQLSSMFHISPYYLTHSFTKMFGIPPHICQTLFRIKQAKQLLRSEMSLAAVAAETGFVDQSHLSRRFKDVVGMTPGKWLRGRKYH